MMCDQHQGPNNEAWTNSPNKTSSVVPVILAITDAGDTGDAAPRMLEQRRLSRPFIQVRHCDGKTGVALMCLARYSKQLMAEKNRGTERGGGMPRSATW